jgi:hypothetical protein
MNTLCIEYWERILGGLNCSNMKKMAAYEEGCFGYVNARQARGCAMQFTVFTFVKISALH